MPRDRAISALPSEAVLHAKGLKDNCSLVCSCPSRWLGFSFILKIIWAFWLAIHCTRSSCSSLSKEKRGSASSPARCPNSWVAWWARILFHDCFPFSKLNTRPRCCPARPHTAKAGHLPKHRVCKYQPWSRGRSKAWTQFPTAQANT